MARRDRKTKAAAPAKKSSPTPTSTATQPNLALPLIVIAAAIALRLTRLMSDVPVVGDESIYLRWAEIIDNQGQWLISLLDGKQPLSYWLLALTRLIWPGDPLLAGRLISVAAGGATTWLVYRIGDRLGGRSVGLVSAALYAILPWAMLYDRLMYTEALVNLGGSAVFWTSLSAFGDDRPNRLRDLGAGLALGLAFFCKSTALLFAPLPLLAGLLYARRQPARLAVRLATIYAAAAVFPLFSWAMTPEAPQLATHSAVFHKTHFFLSATELLADPFTALGANLAALAPFLGAYLTWPCVLAFAAVLAVALRKPYPAVWLLLAASIAPVLLQLAILTKYFSRYPYPHLWPLLVLASLAWSSLREEGKRTAATALVTTIAVCFGLQSLRIVLAPASALANDDASYYFTDRPNAGFGLNQVVRRVLEQADNGPVLVLTDAIWGTPADAVFPYLNRKQGVRVHEAWWIDSDPPGPLLPGQGAEVWRSHYERVSAGRIAWNDYRAIYYVTLTNYRQREDMLARAPGAEIELSIPKPGDREALDLYRLR